MVHAVLMPRPGQMTEECTLVEWHKVEGDPIARGDVLFEIETDKSLMEVEAFDDGVLLRRLVDAGETVAVNSIVAYIGQPGEPIPEPEIRPAEHPEGVEPDVTAEPVAPAAPTQSPRPPTMAAARDGLRISPRASRLAAQVGLDPSRLKGSGPEGRIVERDVRAALDAGPSRPAVQAPTPPAAPPAQVIDGAAPPKPLSRMRRVIAERMTVSTMTIPQFHVSVAVDVTRLVELRSKLKAEGSALTLTDFILAATTQSLVAMPIVNSWTDGEQLWLRRRVHLGLAVAVANGLVVVVLRDADAMSIDEIHERAAGLAAGARAGSLPPDDMTGSTFSVSNLGMHGVESFAAIINPGESAVLAVSSALPTVVPFPEGFGVRTVMRLTLTADHRLIDGETAARFLDDLRGRLQEPDLLVSETPGF